jgi:hypothetical protein
MKSDEWSQGELRNKAQSIEKIERAVYTPFGVEAGWQTGKERTKPIFRIVWLPDFVSRLGSFGKKARSAFVILFLHYTEQSVSS